MIMSKYRVFILLLISISSISMKILFDGAVNFDRLDFSFREKIFNALSNEGFQVVGQSSSKVIGGFKDGCFLWVQTANSELGKDAYFDKSYGNLGRLGVWYRGKVTDEAPSVRALSDRYISRLFSGFGRMTEVYPIYRISYSQECSREQLESLNLSP